MDASARRRATWLPPARWRASSSVCLSFAQRRRRFRGRTAAWASSGSWISAGDARAEHRRIAEHAGVLDGVLQFAHVAGPRVGAEKVERSGRAGGRFVICRAKRRRKTSRAWQFLAALAQRRDLDLECLQPKYKSWRSSPS